MQFPERCGMLNMYEYCHLFGMKLRPAGKLTPWEQALPSQKNNCLEERVKI